MTFYNGLVKEFLKTDWIQLMKVLKLVLSKEIHILVCWMDCSPLLYKHVLFSLLLLVFNMQLQTVRPAMLVPQRKKNQQCTQVYSKCNSVLLLTYSSPGIKVVQHMLPECSSVSKITAGQRSSCLYLRYPGTVTAYIQDTA